MSVSENEALGLLVQRLRKAQGMTQEDLGSRAGYGTGAAVSISRFENGLMTPGPAKLARIADVLGMSLEELKQRSLAEATPSGGHEAAERPKDRAQRVEREAAARKRELVAVNEAFSAAQERAKTDFLAQFSQIAARIKGAQPLAPMAPADRVLDDAPSELGSRKDVTSGPSAAPQLALTFGLLPVLMKGLPVGGIAVPVIAAVAGAAVAGLNTFRHQQQARASLVQQAEAELVHTKSNFSALMSVIPRSTEILEYVAIHGGHALERWERHLGDSEVEWDELDASEKQRFFDFFAIWEAALSVHTIELEMLAKATNGDELQQQLDSIEQTLARAYDTITSKV